MATEQLSRPPAQGLHALPSPPGEAPSRNGSAPPKASSDDTVATVALAVLTFFSALGFQHVFVGSSWLAPLVATLAATHAACWLGRRSRLPTPLAALLALAAVALVGVWTVLPASTSYGVPVAGTLHAISRALSEGQAEFHSVAPPTPAFPGFELMACWTVGLVALLADFAAFRLRSALEGAAPGLALFIGSSALGQPRGLAGAVALESAALLAFLLAHAAPALGGRPERDRPIWFGNRRLHAAGSSARVGAALGSAALLAAMLVAPQVEGIEGTGVLGWRAPAGGPSQREVANPVVDLHTRLIQESATVVFTVKSPVPSYWRLTSLDTFTGQQWIATGSYQSVHRRLPGVQKVPPGTRQVVEKFHIDHLDSAWLPDAFTPESVRGIRHVTYDPDSGSLLTNHHTADGLTYTVTALQYLATLDPGELESAPPLSKTGAMRRYLQLPPSIPSAVKALALKITAGQQSEYAKALALQDFFLSPAFSYSLDPPNDGYGISALTTFLFRTRTGYCQQFAGAYAVLARLAGLPTRLAVGFTSGTKQGADTYVVRDADAHTWPEVYFPKWGWVPFEPTKSFDMPGTGGYLPASAASPKAAHAKTNPAGSPYSATHMAEGRSAVPVSPESGGGISALHSTPLPALGQSPAPGTSPWRLIGFLALAAAGWVLLNSLARGARWRLRRRAAARSARSSASVAPLVLACWEEAGEHLAWWRIRRRPGETDREYALRAESELSLQLARRSLARPPLARLAEAATRAAFAPSVDPGLLRAAEADAKSLHSRLRKAATWRQRLAWLADPALAWRGARPLQPSG